MALNIQMSQKQNDGTYEDLNPITLDINVSLGDTTASNLNLPNGSDVADGLESLDTPIGEIRVFSSERTDLGADYLLCDGSFIATADYPNLDDYLNYEGATWTAMSGISHSSTYKINKIAYGNGIFVAVGYFGRVYYSTNGKKWNLSDILMGSSQVMTDVVYANGRWIVVGYEGASYYSTNGTSWSSMPGIGNNNLYFVSYGNGKWVAGGERDIYYSTNGTSWTEVAGIESLDSDDDTIRYYDAVYGNGRWVVVGSSSYTYYSTDGISWTLMTGITLNNNDDILNVVSYENGIWITGGNRGLFYYSTNGKSWVKTTVDGGRLSSLDEVYDIAYNNGRWVAVGGNLESYYSTNGIDWISMSGLPTGSSQIDDLNSVIYFNNKWITVGDDGRSYYSIDGISWVEMDGIPSNDYNLLTIACSDDRVVTGGEYGYTYQIYDDPDYSELPTLIDADNQVYGYIRALDGTEG